MTSGDETTVAIEAAIFSLRRGTDRAEFLAAAEAVTADVRRMPGFLDRELAEGEDGRWLDLLHWASLEDARRAAAEIMRSPASRPFMEMLDPESISMMHFRRVAALA